ncbi:MAG TPA: hypothetical protein VK988_13745 [Acidimicrobiales bacterium]|nr:hypothetical protein [Acidimicrobiales bacterium]
MATAGLVVLTACTGGGQRSGAPLPTPPAVIDVIMREHRFDYNPTVPAGRVVFRVRNDGRVAHRLTMVPLADDLPPIDAQLRGLERRPATPYAGVPNQAPGASASFAVDLVPGRRYAIVCFAKEPQDDVSHALMGMNSEFRAGATATAQPQP